MNYSEKIPLINNNGYAEQEKRIQATDALLKLLSRTFLRKEYLEAVVKLIISWSGCSCVGIRVINEEGKIPYDAYSGFSSKFWESENLLSLVYDQCVCPRIIAGKPEPQDLPALTFFGSFRCENTFKFIEGLSQTEKARFRGVCVENGFASVAVIPLRYAEKILGAIHLADKKEGKVSLSIVSFIESIAPVIAEALHKFIVVDKLRQNYETQSIISSILQFSLEDKSIKELLKQVLEMILSIPWLGFEPRGAIFLVEDEPDILILKVHSGLGGNVQKECARVAFGRCICGQAALKKEIQFANFLDERHENVTGESGSHGHYCVPVIFAGSILGMITLYVKEGYQNDKRKEEFLMAISNALAGVIKRKQTEEVLRTTNEILERIFSSTQLLIVFMDTNFNFIQVNRAYAVAGGYPPEFFAGKNYFELYPAQAEYKAMFQNVVENGLPYSVFARPFEHREHPEQGITYWDWSLQPVKNQEGEVEGLIMILVDVSERKQAEEKLRKIKEELEKSKRLSDIGALAATVAHELRNPLGVIRMAAYNIKKRRTNPLLDKHLANIEKKILESEQIIDNLLSYSRIKMPHFEKIQICQVLDECIDSAKTRFGELDIPVKKLYNCGEKTVIEADSLQMSELFSNLLNNAFEAQIGKRGEVKVQIEEDDVQAMLMISIQDKGIGIAPEDMEKIQEPFFTRKVKGTGLGLTVCWQIVKLHAGTILFSSELGKGTTVTIKLPVLQKEVKN